MAYKAITDMMLNKKEEDISENQTWVARTIGEQAPN
jgi:hypothetical protein